jgi:hypothetical protein
MNILNRLFSSELMKKYTVPIIPMILTIKSNKFRLLLDNPGFINFIFGLKYATVTIACGQLMVVSMVIKYFFQGVANVG